MRDAKINDTWRHINSPERFSTKITNIHLENVIGFDKLNVSPRSAITSICGKNGVGKTTLMRFIYNSLRGGEYRPDRSRFGEYACEIEIYSNNNKIIINQDCNDALENIFYLEPSQECTKILNYIRITANFNELLDGVEENPSFNNEKIKASIEKTLGKSYKSIKFKEIDSAMEDDYTFPFFEVELYSGIKYSNADMGMGEFAVLYIIWFMYYCEKNSILFIEEPENYISASTQRYLMDKIAEIADAKHIWITISTHSEHILSKINIENTKVLLKKITTDVTQVVEPEHRERYLMALGLTPPIKGIIFVEDFFAEKFLTYLLIKHASYLLKNHKIIPIRCDSNIEKIVLHYQPQKESPLNYIGIFDADQKDKIFKYIGNEVYVSALPGTSPLAPEILVWEMFFQKIESASKVLNVSIDIISESIEENRHANYHDRYQLIANDINKPLDVLLDCLLNLWFEDEINDALSQKFIQTLINSHTKQKITINKINDDYIEFSTADSFYSISKHKLKNPSLKNISVGAEFDANIYFDSESFILLIS